MIIWISLAAVVVIIVVIGVLFRLFLRADDADPFDEIPDEPRRPSRPAEEPRPRQPVAAVSGRRPPSRPAPAADMPRAAGRGRGSQDRRPADRRDSGSNRRPAPTPAPVRAGQARPAESAAKATKWDKMSDVDYWTELKSVDDQPTIAAPAADPLSPAPGRRRAPEPVAGARAASGDQTVQLPVRQRSPRNGASRNGSPSSGSPSGGSHGSGPHSSSSPGNGSAPRSRPSDYGQPSGPHPAHAPGRYAGGEPEPVTEGIAALARLGSRSSAQRPVSRPRPATRQAPAAALDDDPLTSPSFPAINASDSRSYRASRHDSQPRNIPAPGYTEPAQQFGGYPGAPDRTISPPNGYPIQPGASAGNPYGSFVSQPAASQPTTSYGRQPSAPASPDPTYASPDATYASPDPTYASPDAAYGQHAAQPGADWYGSHPSGPMPMPAFTAEPQPGYPSAQQPYGADPAGYPPSYQGGQPDPANYGQPGYGTPQYDPRVYGSQEPGYGRDGYQGYPGYGSGNY
jgi:hypothetical protein